MDKVSICVCTLDTVPLEWVIRTWGPLAYAAQQDYNKFCRLIRGSISVAQKRNIMVQSSLLDKETTHIMFMDNDVIYEGKDANEGLREMLKLDKDILSGLVRTRQPKYPYMAYYSNKDNSKIRNLTDDDIRKTKGDTIPVDSLGCSFVMIKRRVYEEVPSPWFTVHNMEANTEDIDFFLRCKQHKFQPYVAKNVKLSHLSSLKIMSNGEINTILEG